MSIFFRKILYLIKIIKKIYTIIRKVILYNYKKIMALRKVYKQIKSYNKIKEIYKMVLYYIVILMKKVNHIYIKMYKF
jgi:hypothetical protein